MDERNHAIMVWRFYEAPWSYQRLSGHGGDEDWVALVPRSFYERHGLPDWMDSGSRFGCCDVSEHKMPNGDVVAIGAHA